MDFKQLRKIFESEEAPIPLGAWERLEIELEKKKPRPSVLWFLGALLFLVGTGIGIGFFAKESVNKTTIAKSLSEKRHSELSDLSSNERNASSDLALATPNETDKAVNETKLNAENLALKNSEGNKQTVSSANTFTITNKVKTAQNKNSNISISSKSNRANLNYINNSKNSLVPTNKNNLNNLNNRELRLLETINNVKISNDSIKENRTNPSNNFENGILNTNIKSGINKSTVNQPSTALYPKPELINRNNTNVANKELSDRKPTFKSMPNHLNTFLNVTDENNQLAISESEAANNIYSNVPQLNTTAEVLDILESKTDSVLQVSSLIKTDSLASAVTMPNESPKQTIARFSLWGELNLGNSPQTKIRPNNSDGIIMKDIAINNQWQPSIIQGSGLLKYNLRKSIFLVAGIVWKYEQVSVNSNVSSYNQFHSRSLALDGSTTTTYVPVFHSHSQKTNRHFIGFQAGADFQILPRLQLSGLLQLPLNTIGKERSKIGIQSWQLGMHYELTPIIQLGAFWQQSIGTTLIMTDGTAITRSYAGISIRYRIR